MLRTGVDILAFSTSSARATLTLALRVAVHRLAVQSHDTQLPMLGPLDAPKERCVSKRTSRSTARWQ